MLNRRGRLVDCSNIRCLGWGYPHDGGCQVEEVWSRPLSAEERQAVDRFERAPDFPCRVCDEAGVMSGSAVVYGVVQAAQVIPCPMCSAVMP